MAAKNSQRWTKNIHAQLSQECKGQATREILCAASLQKSVWERAGWKSHWLHWESYVTRGLEHLVSLVSVLWVTDAQ